MFNDADDLEKKEKAADQHLEHDADHLEMKKKAADQHLELWGNC